MLWKKRRRHYPEIVINGTSVPEGYRDGDVYGTTIIAKDGYRYAHVDDQGLLITGQASTPGRLSLEGRVLEYERPRKDEQLIRADVRLDHGRIYIGSQPRETETHYSEPSR